MAVERAERAVGLHADNYSPWELLGIAAHRASVHELAMSALTRAVRIDSAQPTGHKNLSNTLRDDNQYRSAVGAYRGAITLKPDYPDAHNNLAAVRRVLGDTESALSSCQRPIALRLSATQGTATSNVVRKTIDLTAPVVVPSDYGQTRDT